MLFDMEAISLCTKMYLVIWATGKQYEMFHGFLLKLPTDDKQRLRCHDWKHRVRYNEMIDIYSFCSNGKLTKSRNGKNVQAIDQNILSKCPCLLQTAKSLVFSERSAENKRKFKSFLY